MPKTILAVDYDQKTLEEIKTLLEDLGVQFLMANDGIQAVNVIRSSTPDLVLTSALLPKLNGFELCKKITTGELGEIRPVVVFSGIYKAEKYRKEAIQGCGASDFLEKPLVQAHLVKVVRNLLCHARAQQPVPSTVLPSNQILLDDPEPISMTSLIGEADLHASDDPLEVDELFEPSPAIPAPEIEPPTDLKEPPLQNPFVPDTQVPLLPPDSKDEIEAALASILIDSDREVQLRDQRIAEEIELEIASIGQNILELEQTLGGSSHGGINHEPENSQIIELEDGESPNSLASASLPDTTEQAPPGSETPEERGVSSSPAPSIPNFSVDSKHSPHWVPMAILMLVLLGAAIIFLLTRR